MLCHVNAQYQDCLVVLCDLDSEVRIKAWILFYSMMGPEPGPLGCAGQCKEYQGQYQT